MRGFPGGWRPTFIATAPVRPGMTEHTPVSVARASYEAIDDGAYAELSDLLAPGFRQVRGDRAIEGRDAFVRFMREGRPETDTTHAVDAVYRTDDGTTARAEEGHAQGSDEVAVRGRLLRPDGAVWFGFVDVFEVVDGRLARLVTYTNDRVE